MRSRRISPVMIAGIIAILAALGLIYLISTGGVFTQIDPTAQQQTVDAIVRTRLTQTAEIRQSATVDPNLDPIWQTATALKQMIGTDEPEYPYTPEAFTVDQIWQSTIITETVTPQP